MIQIHNNNLDALARQHAHYYKDKIRPNLSKIEDDQLKRFIEIHFEQLFDAKPNHIKAIIRQFKTLRIEFGGKTNSLRENVKAVFDYDEYFSKNDTDNGAYKLAKKLKVDICPFCNRQYTFTVGKRSKGTRHAFDHFYPQKLYPFLALSFYNLIPICSTCNSLKSSTDVYDKPMVHPYLESFGPKIFTTQIKKVEDIIGTEHKDLKIEFISSRPKHVDHSIKKLKLDLLYAEHTDYAHEIIQKAYMYSDSRVQELYESFPALFSSEADIKRMVFGNYTQDTELDKRPLAKLTRDLLLELGIVSEFD